MQENVELVKKMMKDLSEPLAEGRSGEFLIIAKQIADVSLSGFRDELLAKGLAIAKAVAEFDFELYNK